MVFSWQEVDLELIIIGQTIVCIFFPNELINLKLKLSHRFQFLKCGDLSSMILNLVSLGFPLLVSLTRHLKMPAFALGSCDWHVFAIF